MMTSPVSSSWDILIIILIIVADLDWTEIVTYFLNTDLKTDFSTDVVESELTYLTESFVDSDSETMTFSSIDVAEKSDFSTDAENSDFSDLTESFSDSDFSIDVAEKLDLSDLDADADLEAVADLDWACVWVPLLLCLYAFLFSHNLLLSLLTDLHWNTNFEKMVKSRWLKWPLVKWPLLKWPLVKWPWLKWP